ncbi:hypothetical protein Cgig2_000894 [Carnegiea gigantea]|uniref:peroxidase n=1 Tax=Carnegiea gigantea TaxID=171969 RepID=A0A9Q1GUL9_9CARY|nr:hypothetical protein Cgig2_000894 [Carnegiea gigantea]
MYEGRNEGPLSLTKGCDGSVFLDGGDTEKTATPSQDLGGFNTVDDIKTAIEKICPEVVSCADVLRRLYNVRNSNKPDPTISSSLLQLLQNTCPLNSQSDDEAFLDQTPNSHFILDNAYYNQILAHNGTMEIDQNMALHPLTSGLVKGLADSPDQFLDQFGAAMVKMARIGVLTGNQGKIRKTCSSVN